MSKTGDILFTTVWAGCPRKVHEQSGRDGGCWSDRPCLWRLSLGPVKGTQIKFSKGLEARHCNLRNGSVLCGALKRSRCRWDTGLQELGETAGKEDWGFHGSASSWAEEGRWVLSIGEESVKMSQGESYT